jgi:hypothetical protein
MPAGAGTTKLTKRPNAIAIAAGASLIGCRGATWRAGGSLAGCAGSAAPPAAAEGGCSSGRCCCCCCGWLLGPGTRALLLQAYCCCCCCCCCCVRLGLHVLATSVHDQSGCPRVVSTCLLRNAWAHCQIASGCTSHTIAAYPDTRLTPRGEATTHPAQAHSLTRSCCAPAVMTHSAHLKPNALAAGRPMRAAGRCCRLAACCWGASADLLPSMLVIKAAVWRGPCTLQIQGLSYPTPGMQLQMATCRQLD